MSILDSILGRQQPQAPATPQQPGPGVLEALLSAILKRPANPQPSSSPSIFDARDAIGQHNQQLQRSLEY